MRGLFLATAAAAIAGAAPSPAAENTQNLSETLALEPPEWEVGDLTIRLGGFAGGALFSAQQSGGPLFPGGYDNTRASGRAGANIRVQRILDNGMILGAGGDFLLYRDELSGNNYDNDTVEKLYLFAQTGFGRIEIGQTDGAGYSLALTGPIVDEQVSLESRKISLFRNPVTGRDFAEFFKQVTAVQSSSNYAKIHYVSPRLLGIQIGASFTPQTVRSPLPFTGNPRDDADQQQNIWEAAISYTGYFSDLALGLSAGFAQGSLKNRSSGSDDLYDWALGAQLAYPISGVKLSLGGAYRETDANLLHVGQVTSQGRTQAVHVSTTAEWGSWIAGGEYSLGDVKGPVDYEIRGYQLSAGYRLNDNLQFTAGWQWYDYERNIGTFYNGLPAISMNAAFLSLFYAL